MVSIGVASLFTTAQADGTTSTAQEHRQPALAISSIVGSGDFPK